MTIQNPVFLPLVVDAARAAQSAADAPARAAAVVVRRHAEAADTVASDCWTALLAGCQTTARRTLPVKLRELTQATSLYLGTHCWFSASSPHRLRVTDAQERITDAVREGDGAEFAAAFAGYDQAVAPAMASVRGRRTAVVKQPEQARTGEHASHSSDATWRGAAMAPGPKGGRR
jgi:hypothetical protein